MQGEIRKNIIVIIKERGQRETEIERKRERIIEGQRERKRK